MREEETKVWAWLVPSGRIYRVVSNPAGGTISLYDSDGTLVRRYETLSKAEVCLIEKNFLELVATLVSESGAETGEGSKREMAEDIAMYIR